MQSFKVYFSENKENLYLKKKIIYNTDKFNAIFNNTDIFIRTKVFSNLPF